MPAPQILAESIQFSAAEILMILLALLGMLIAAGAVVVFGFIFAKRAGRGSQKALVGWGIIGAGELAVLIGSLFNEDALFSGLLMAGVLGGQVAMFLKARKKPSA